MPERQGSALHTARQVLIPLPSGKRYSQSVSFSSLEEFKDSNNPISRGHLCPNAKVIGHPFKIYDFANG